MTTLFLATTGGHLHELDELAGRVPADRSLWVTHANEQSRSMLAGREVIFVPYVRPRKVGDVLRCVPSARTLLRRHGVDRVVSTGSGIALGYLPYLAARGVDCHYIESVARIRRPSVTGRVLERFRKVHVYTQYPVAHEGRWKFVGSVFDAYAPVPVEDHGGGRLRVVVTIGTAHEYPFRRLIERLAPVLAPGGALAAATGREVEVLWQTGSTPVEDLGIVGTPFLAAGDLAAALGRAHVVVSHAGAGSALATLAAGRLPVLVNRLARFGEAPDDHQRQLAEELERRGLALACTPEELTHEALVRSMSTGIARVGDPPLLSLDP